MRWEISRPSSAFSLPSLALFHCHPVFFTHHGGTGTSVSWSPTASALNARATGARAVGNDRAAAAVTLPRTDDDEEEDMRSTLAPATRRQRRGRRSAREAPARDKPLPDFTHRSANRFMAGFRNKEEGVSFSVASWQGTPDCDSRPLSVLILGSTSRRPPRNTKRERGEKKRAKTQKAPKKKGRNIIKLPVNKGAEIRGASIREGRRNWVEIGDSVLETRKKISALRGLRRNDHGSHSERGLQDPSCGPVSAAPPRKSRMRGRVKPLGACRDLRGSDAGLPPAPGTVSKRPSTEDG